ncbi:hypothetical protein HMSSN036_42320 [Paenibacillus macerans]|nr:hypothetical protein HMSSN036_42320 [Paenibacillus macerans]
MFGGAKAEPLPAEQRKRIAAAVMPLVRGLASGDKPVIVTFDDEADVLEFTGSRDAAQCRNRRRLPGSPGAYQGGAAVCRLDAGRGRYRWPEKQIKGRYRGL